MDSITAGPACGCPHHKVVPGFIALFGLLFLLHAFGIFTDMFVDVAWPVLVLLAGLTKMFSRGCKCCSHG